MSEKKSISFTLFQWNTLNRYLSNKKSFPYADEKILVWEHRHPLIKKIINENKGDIISLEEIGNFEKDFKEEIFEKCEIKYDLKYGPKPSHFMGSILGVNKELFSIEKYENIILNGIDGKQSDQNIISALIKDKNSNIEFVVIVIHLKAKAENENIRIVQTEHLIKYIEENLIGKYPIFLMGDFNAEPSYSSIIKLLENKNICAKSLFDLKNLDFTTIKLRDVLIRRIIDYIFFIPKNKENCDKELKILSIEKALPSMDEKIGLPNDIFPSDHLFLKAKVELNLI